MARVREIADSQILDITRKLLLNKGFSLSTRTVAAAAGISEGVIFQRFHTKTALFTAALAGPEIDWDSAITAASTHPDPRRALEDVAVALFRAIRQVMPALLPALGKLDEARRALGRSGAAAEPTAALTRYLTARDASGHLRVPHPGAAAFLVVSALHQAAMLEVVLGPSPQVNERAVRQTIGVLWSGLEPAEAG